MAATVLRIRSKSAFVKELLKDHPRSNAETVNEAWRSAGMEGVISPGLINKIRSESGLAGNLRFVTKRKKRSQAVEVIDGKPVRRDRLSVGLQGRNLTRSVRSHLASLDELEADLDSLIYKVMSAGNLTSLEESLRESRRVLYRSLDQ